MKTKTKLIIGASVALAGVYLLWYRNKKKKAVALAPAESSVSAPSQSSVSAPAQSSVSSPAQSSVSSPVITPAPVSNSTYGSYRYGIAQSGCTISWTNKDGSRGSQFVAKGEFANISCMVDGSGSGCGQWTKTSSC